MKLILFILALYSVPSLAVPALVQATHTPLAGGSSTTVTAAFSSNITAGSLVVVWITWGYDSPKPSSVTDSEGNTYVEIPNTYVSDTPMYQYTNLYYKENTTCTGPCGGATVTATWAAGKTYRAMTIAEFSGVATTSALDQSIGQLQNSTTAPTSTSVSTSTNGQLVVGTTFDSSSSSVTITLESSSVSNTGPTDGAAMQYEIQTSSGSIASDFTFSGARNAQTAVATFRDATPVKIKHKVISD